MKKIFILFAFVFIALSAKSQYIVTNLSLNKAIELAKSSNSDTSYLYNNGVKLMICFNKDRSASMHKINAIDKIGSKHEISKEVDYRNLLISEYKKSGYIFVNMINSKNGKFMKFVRI